MMRTLPGARFPGLPLALLFAVGSTAAATPRAFHFELMRSAPADKATVHQVSEVRLWFSEAPEENTVSIHVLNAAGDPVRTGDAKPDARDPSVFSAAVPDALTPGAYTVSWRGMGDDGHVVRGRFSFDVETSTHRLGGG